MTFDISLQTFHDAARAIQGKVIRSPLIEFAPSLLLKAECLQPSGSFKIRGASYAMSKLTQDERARGVVAYSTGNHAQAVALAAKRLNVPATIVMSPDVMEFKLARTESYGAKVVMTEPSSHARKALAERFVQEEGLTMIAPYDSLDIIAGQGTIGLEIMQDMTPSHVFVPVGGGGLISGIAMAIKKINPKVVMVGVEPELENDAYRSFQTGERVSLSGPSNSIADAIKIQQLGSITYPIMKEYVDEMIQVSEEEIKNATRRTLDECHLFVEPSGALALAGALAYKPGGLTVCVASGGNTRLGPLSKLLNN